MSGIKGQRLKDRVFRGGAWIAAATAIEQACRFGRNLILARLLTPGAFGAMAIVLSTASVVDSLSEIGAKESLIRNPRSGEGIFLNAAWWLAVVRGLFIYGSLFILAPSIGRFYRNPEMTFLIRAGMLNTLFVSLISPKLYLSIREMSFGRTTVILNGGGIVGIVITVALAFHIHDARILAIGLATEGAARCILSYCLCPYLPRLQFDRAAALELLQFSRGLFGLSFLNLIFSRADIFVLAKLFAPRTVGLYTMAIYLAQNPGSVIMSMLNQCLLPAYSQLQANTERINRVLLRVTYMIMLLGLPVVAFCFLSGESLLVLLYGSDYGAGAASLLVAMTIAVLNVANSQITLVFYALGRPQLHRACVGLMALIMVLTVYPFSRAMGQTGGQIAALLAVSAGYLFQLLRMRTLTGFRFGGRGQHFNAAALIASAVIVVFVMAGTLVSSASPRANVAAGLLGCALAYSLTGLLMVRRQSRLIGPEAAISGVYQERK